MAEVVVVGAGLAGLACAHRLAACGHRVEVYERERVPGGRLRTRREDGFVLEPAGATLLHGDRHLEALCAEVGLAGALEDADPRRAVLRGGRLGTCDLSGLRALLRTAPVGAGTRVRLPWLLLELFRARRRLDARRPGDAAALDGATLAASAGRHLGEEAVAAVLTPALAALRAETPEEVSAALGLAALHRLQETGARPRALGGGVGRLVRALADGLAVRVGWEVVGVAADAAGVRVRYVTPSGERTRRADGVVLALPAAEVRRLDAPLGEPERAFLDGLDDAPPRTVAHLLFEKAPPALPATVVDVPAAEGGALREIAACHALPGRAPLGAGALRVLLRDEASARLAGASGEEVAASVEEALADTGLGLPPPDAVRVLREAAPRPRFGPGTLAALRALRRDAEPGRCVLARAWRTAATPEGAAAAGHAAAEALHAQLG